MSGDSSVEPSAAKRGWGVPGALFLGLCAYFLPSVLAVFFVPSVQGLNLASPNAAVFLSVVIYELLTIGIIYAFVRAYGFSLRDLGLTKFKPSALGLVFVGFVVYLFLSILFSTLVQWLVGFDQNQPQELGFSNPQGLEILLVFLALVVLAPIAEELLFRGFIFKGLRKTLSFWWTAVIVSVLFALVHWQVNVALDVFVLSLVLCWLRERTGSLWPSIILHAGKNAVAFLLLFVFKVV